MKKIGREINGIPVLPEDDSTLTYLKICGIKEVVFAIPSVSNEDKKSYIITMYRPDIK